MEVDKIIAASKELCYAGADLNMWTEDERAWMEEERRGWQMTELKSGKTLGWIARQVEGG